MRAVYRSDTGALVSIGSVLADPLPAGLASVQVATDDVDAIAAGNVTWDTTERAFTYRAPTVIPPLVPAPYATERDSYTKRLNDLRVTAKTYNTVDSFTSATGWSTGVAKTIDGTPTLRIGSPSYITQKNYGTPLGITDAQTKILVRFHVTGLARFGSLRVYFYDAGGVNGYGGIITPPTGGAFAEGWNVTTLLRSAMSNIGTPPGWGAIQQMRLKVYAADSVNYPAVSVSEVTFYSLQPLCSIWFDDGHASVVTEAEPRMTAHGFTGSLTVQGQLDYYPGEHMSAQDHRGLAAAGWDLSNHTWSHPDLSTLGDAANEAEISRGLDMALKLGGGAAAYHFVPPMGRTNAHTLRHARTYATLLRRYSGPNAMPVPDFYAITSSQPAADTPAATVCGWIDDAIANQQWLILLFHLLTPGPTATGYSYPTDEFQTILNYLDTHRASITTLPPTLAIASM